MRSPIAFIFLIAIGLSCQNTKHRTFPADFEKVLNHHGGLDSWGSFRTLSFTIDSTDHYTVDLQDRRELIKTPSFEIGFDGINVWSKADTSFKSDPKFLKNLMFYFYAMPFVLADPGINYTTLESKTILGNPYEGIKITYGDSVGLSPKDEYYLYFDKVTGQMTWLAYTVTYFSGKKSDRVSWIKYDEWQSVDALLLPQQLVWYKSGPSEIRSQRLFSNIKLSVEEMPSGFYDPVEGSKIAE